MNASEKIDDANGCPKIILRVVLKCRAKNVVTSENVIPGSADRPVWCDWPLNSAAKRCRETILGSRSTQRTSC